MLSMNSSQTVPALVHSGSTSTTSTTTAPVTPIGETKSISPVPLPNKRSSKAGLKTKLSKLGRSTKSLFRGTFFYKPVPPRPPFSVADSIWVVKERSIHIDAAPSHRYNRAAAVSDTQIDMYIPLPCAPSRISLIPLHDGHILQSPAVEHHEEDINSHGSLATLTEIPHLPHLESSHALIPMTVAVSSPKLSKTVQVPRPSRIPPFPKYDRTGFSASQGLSCPPRREEQPPTRQSRLDFDNGSLSLSSIPAVPQQSPSRSIITPWLHNASHLPDSLISRSSRLIFKYTVGIAMTAGLGYYIYVSVFA